jgi:hypothetical protein
LNPVGSQQPQQQALIHYGDQTLDESAAAEARNNEAAMDASGTEAMEEWDAEDLHQLTGLVTDDMVFEMSEGDRTVQ